MNRTKQLLPVYFLIGVGFLCNAQQFSPENSITTEALGARTVELGDIDGDGFLDIVSANQWANEVVWIRNLGNGNFSDRIIIATLQETINASIGDMDGDGDLDVIAISGPLDKIVWYENLDGAGSFAVENIISAGSIRVSFTLPVDLDGDGDIDIISGSDNVGIEWHKNLDGEGTSWQTILIDSILSRSQAAADMDGDGDLDIVAGTGGDRTVVWYENIDGSANFSERKIISGAGSFITSVEVIDVDNDNDNDIVTCTFTVEVAWHENIDGAGNFGSKQIFGDNLEGGTKVSGSDLDNDGDVDIACAFAVDDTVAWYENSDGNGNFDTEEILSSNADVARWVAIGDLDNDGDNDIVAASRNDNKIAWYENLEILGLEDNPLDAVQLFPNPTSDTLHIEIPKHVTIQKAVVRDLLGKTVLRKEKPSITSLNLRSLPTGFYFVTVSDGRFETTRKVVVK